MFGLKVNLFNLRLLGFDLSRHVPFTKEFKVKCSCCEAMTVNGTPLHETGCSQAMHECNGCNSIIPKGQKYCDDCR